MKLVIASGKGGTGKTTLSVNLAAALTATRPVVLADLDVEEPNSGLFLKGRTAGEQPLFRMVPEWRQEDCSLCGNCRQVCNFNAVIKLPGSVMVFPQLCHGCYACSELCPSAALPMTAAEAGTLRRQEIQYNGASHPLHFVEGRLFVGEEQAVPVIRQTIDFTETAYPPEYIRLFDAPPGTACPMLEAVKHADLVLLVTEPTPFGFHDLQLAVETVRDLNKPFAVIINKDGIGDDRVLNYCRDQKIPVPAKLPNDRAIAAVYSRGETVYGNHEPFSLEIDRLIKWLDNRNGGNTDE